MKKLLTLLLLTLLLLLTACLPKQETTNLTIKNLNMKLTSPAFQHNTNLPAKYTCDGEKINPPLLISEVPANAQSLVLIMDDPDAPIGTFVHWLAWNIDPKTTSITENILPQGAITGKNSGKKTGYYPPCPPSGTHRYIFKLYALDIKLDLQANADKSQLEQAMQGHILDSVELISLYSRQ